MTKKDYYSFLNNLELGIEQMIKDGIIDIYVDRFGFFYYKSVKEIVDDPQYKFKISNKKSFWEFAVEYGVPQQILSSYIEKMEKIER